MKNVVICALAILALALQSFSQTSDWLRSTQPIETFFDPSKPFSKLGSTGINNTVFVTSTTFTGSLGGLSGADSACQVRAASAGLTGTYRAWLSTTTSSPAARFPHSDSPYALVNGTLIANDWTDLTDGSLLAPIDRTESGDTVSSSLVWTSTQANGSFGGSGTCSDWTSTAASTAITGDTSATTSAWTFSGVDNCNASARLYCFLQVSATPSISGTVNVGPGETFTNLTNLDGLFQALNNDLVLAGDLTVNITGDLMNESGTNALRQLTEEGAGAGTYRILIKPSGGPRTISGDFLGELIKLNGADRVTIDGWTGAAIGVVPDPEDVTRDLTITNTSLTSFPGVVFFYNSGLNPSQNNTIQNVNIVGTSTTYVGIAFGGNGGGLGGDNDNNRVLNCSIKSVNYGIYVQGQSEANPDLGTQIADNVLDATGADSVRRIGIVAINQDGIDIRRNRVYVNRGGANGTAIGIGLGVDVDSKVASTASTSGGIFNGTVAENRISGVVGSTFYGAHGIAVAGGLSGTNTIVNNMITGVVSTPTFPDVTSGIFVSGVAGSSTRLLHNSVSMTGDRGVATQTPSAGLWISGGDRSVEVKNNIFYTTQTSSSIGAGAISYSIANLSSTFSNFDSNFNAFYSSGAQDAGFRAGNIALPTIAEWQTAVSDDADSQDVDPAFVDSAADLHLQAASPILNDGTDAGTTNDIDGDARPLGGGFEIGADEFVPSLAPEMDVRGNEISIADGDTTPSLADQTNLGSEYVSAGSLARNFFIYNTGTANLELTGTPRVVISGPHASDFTVTTQPLSPVTGPSGVTFFQIAFDPSAPGVRSATVSIANNDSDEDPYTFSIQGTGNPVFNGSYNICDGGTYPTLRSFFDAVNSREFTGDVTAVVAGDCLETSTATLSNWVEIPLSGHTLTIKPSGARMISGSVAEALIRVNGADKVIFDGLNSGGNSLTINNDHPDGTALWFSGSTGSAARNMTVRAGSSNSTTAYGIGFGGAIGESGAGIDGNTVENNRVLRANTGIFVFAHPADRADDITISNNIVGPAVSGADNIGSSGISVALLDDPVVSGNTVRNVVSTGDAYGLNVFFSTNNGVFSGNTFTDILSGGFETTGMRFATGTVPNHITGNTISNITNTRSASGGQATGIQNDIWNSLVDENSISNISASGTGGGSARGILTRGSNVVLQSNTISSVRATIASINAYLAYGIDVGNGSTNVQVMRNRISGVWNAGVGGRPARGISVETNISASNVVLANNMVSDVVSVGDTVALLNDQPVGIMIGGATGGVDLYFNSVLLSGAHTGTNDAVSLHAALGVGADVTDLDIRNNVFANSYDNLSSSNDKSYAIFSSAPSSAFTVIDHNDYFVSGPVGVLAFIGTDRLTLADIQTGFGGNASSISTDPLFVSSTDLHVQSSSPLSGLGSPIASVTLDFDGESRSDSAPYIGADEFLNTPPVAVDDDFATPQDEALVLSEAQLTGNDTDPDVGQTLTITAVFDPTNGTVSIHAGTVTFTPTTGFTGTAGFDYSVSDGIDADTGHVTVTVTPPDTTPPDTTITGGPSGTVTDSTATFEFESSETGSTFECSLDGAAFAACVSGVDYTGLANGNHYFQVRATDDAGNTDLSPATRTWMVRAGTGEVTLVVDRLDDSVSAGECTAAPNDCSLRRAIETSADGDTVTFDANLFNSLTEGVSPLILLGGTEIAISSDISITGPGANLLTISGNSASRIFSISGSSATITGVTLTGGNGLGPAFNGDGGAILVYGGGSLSMDGVHVRGNTAASEGGGISLLSGPNSIVNSTISSNQSGSFGGGTYYDANAVVTTISNTTISDNYAGDGGGIHAENGTLTLRGVTITLNEVADIVGSGGGIRVDGAAVSIGNSIIAGNLALFSQTEIDNNNSGVTSAGFNLIGNSMGDGANTGLPITYLATDILDTDPLLGPLQNNGGPTPTHAFNLSLGMSPAIDAGSAFGLTTDQRGSNRTVNYPSVANVDDGTDIGAYELLAPTAAPASISGRVLTRTGAGIRGVVVTVQGMDGEVRTVTTNTFGHYRIEGLSAGASYVVTVSSRRYAFANGTQLVSLDDNISGLDFTATR